MRMNKIIIKVVKILNKTLSNKLILKLKLQEKIKVTRNFKNLKRFKEKIYPKMKSLKKIQIKKIRLIQDS